MSKRTKIILSLILLALVLASAYLFWRLFDRYYLQAAGNDGKLAVYFLDVGQGDAILIRTPDKKNILIDGGPEENILVPLSQVLPWYERTIDLVILTHPHDDHAAGLIPLFYRYRIGQVLYTGVTHNSPAYIEWLEIIMDKKIPLTIIDRPQMIDLGGEARLEIIYPLESMAGKDVPNLNNSSIVSRLVYQERSFLFMGDAETEVEKELLDNKIDLSSDVIKAGHHGSDTSSSEEFIAAVQPSIAVMMLGQDNKFGHPNLRVVKRYERAGAAVYRTDTGGTLGFFVDEDEIRRIEN